MCFYFSQEVDLLYTMNCWHTCGFLVWNWLAEENFSLARYCLVQLV